MKKLSTILIAVFISVTIWSKSPEKISYQAVVRNSSNALVTNTQVGMEISILQNSVNGTAVYVETHTPTTNKNGLVNLQIGAGTVLTGDFTMIDWSADLYFVKIEIDPTGGTNYTITSANQLLSVPYALHAKTAESLIGNNNESDPVFTSSPASEITNTSISNYETAFSWGNHASAGYLTTEVDGSVTNELQILSIKNDTIYLSNGGFVKLPAGFDGQYSSLSGAPVNVSTFINDAGYIITEADSSVTNEIQTISKTGLTVTLSLNGGSFTDSIKTYYAGSGIDISNTDTIINTAPNATHTGDVSGSSVLTINTGVVTSEKIADGSITTTDIADGTITTNDIATDAITAADIATGAVGTSEIADGSITSADIATDAITAADIAAGAVGTSEICDGCVYSVDIATDAITAADIAAGAVGTSEISNGSITLSKLSTSGMTTGTIIYYNGTSWVALPAGTSGQTLKIVGGVPTWSN